MKPDFATSSQAVVYEIFTWRYCYILVPLISSICPYPCLCVHTYTPHNTHTHTLPLLPQVYTAFIPKIVVLIRVDYRPASVRGRRLFAKCHLRLCSIGILVYTLRLSIETHSRRTDPAFISDPLFFFFRHVAYPSLLPPPPSPCVIEAGDYFRPRLN